jgi:hypothetical protein
MEVSMWLMLLYVFLVGAVGGVVNALMTDNGFILPKSEDVDGKTTVLRPGYLGNILIGAVGAVVSWGLYGPLSSFNIVGTSEALTANASPERVGLTLAALVGAVMVGVAGARWLTSEVDKNLLKAAASQAAGSQSSAGASQKIAMASPAEALNIARSMRRQTK